MNLRYGFLICALVLVAGYCRAACPDSAYVKRFDDHFHIRAYTGLRLAELQYENEKTDEERTYKPNINGEVGIGIAWKRLGLSTKLYGFRPNKKYGKTDALDFQGYWYPSRLQVSFSLQDYKGFYTKNGGEITIRPDLKMKLYRLYGEYLFNNRSFSYRSAYNYDERQLVSSGTWKAGLGFYYTSLSADSTLMTNGAFEYPTTVEDYQVAATVGYAHNFVFGKRLQWFANTSVTAGVGVSVKNNDNKVAAFPTFYPRVALGYHGENWTVGGSAYYLTSQVSEMKDASTSLHTGFFKLSYSYRLERCKLFRRR